VLVPLGSFFLQKHPSFTKLGIKLIKASRNFSWKQFFCINKY